MWDLQLRATRLLIPALLAGAVCSTNFSEPGHLSRQVKDVRMLSLRSRFRHFVMVSGASHGCITLGLGTR